MNTIKKLLLINFSLILIGIIGKSILIFSGALPLLTISLTTHLLLSVIYGILALRAQQNRIEGGMLALTGPIVLSILFKLLYWPGASVFLVLGSSVLLLTSIGVLIYTIVNKRKVSLGVMFFTIGLSSLFFCFKWMDWPYPSVLFLPAGAGIIASIFVVVVRKSKLGASKIVLFTIMFLVAIVYTSSRSDIYYFKTISSLDTKNIYPEHLHKYAWMLYNEGKVDKARNYLNIVISAVGDTKSVFVGTEEISVDLTARYQRALDSLNNNSWNEFEEEYFSF